jgi:hypothetical protein
MERKEFFAVRSLVCTEWTSNIFRKLNQHRHEHLWSSERKHFDFKAKLEHVKGSTKHFCFSRLAAHSSSFSLTLMAFGSRRVFLCGHFIN